MKTLWIFFQIALASFGGIYSTWALMEKSFVTPCEQKVSEKHKLSKPKQCIGRQVFDQIFSISRIMPGPRATGVSLLGFNIGGIPYMLLLILTLILPGLIIIPLLTTLYNKWEHIQMIQYMRDGAVMAIIAILLSFLMSLLRRGFNIQHENYQIELFFIIALSSFYLNRKFRVNPAILVLLGGITGFFLLT